MDGSRFDTLSRALVSRHSRYGWRRLLAGLAVAGPRAVLGLDATDAKNRKKKHKKKKRGSPPPAAQCPASCPVCQACSDGQSCTAVANGTACGTNRTCASGQCLCASGFFPCDGSCCLVCDASVGAVCLDTCAPDMITLDICDTGYCCACDGTRRPCNGVCVSSCPAGQRFNDACACVPG